MQLTQKHLEYWSKNLRITGILLFIWFVVTFVVGYYARELSFNFFGWPFAFYMAAQGSLIIYVIIIWYYARYMNNLDRRLRRARRGGRLMATPAQGTGGLFSAGTQKRVQRPAEEGLHLVHRRVPRSSSSRSPSPSRWACRGTGSATCSCSPRSASTPASA